MLPAPTAGPTSWPRYIGPGRDRMSRWRDRPGCPLEATMPVHPEAQQLLDALREAGMPPFESMTVPQAREATKGFLDLQGEPEEIAVDNRTVPGPAGDIPVRIYTPDGSGARPLIVYFHGGGWVIGDLDTVDGRCARWPTEPARWSSRWTTGWRPSTATRPRSTTATPPRCGRPSTRAELGADPARRSWWAGDSAGGNLAAAVALAARDRGGPRWPASCCSTRSPTSTSAPRPTRTTARACCCSGRPCSGSGRTTWARRTWATTPTSPRCGPTAWAGCRPHS